jgi:hypothetical protein
VSEASRTGVEAQSARYHVSLPRFLVTEPIGAGTLVKRVTSSVGITPCVPCERRASQMNRFLSFGPTKPQPNPSAR